MDSSINIKDLISMGLSAKTDAFGKLTYVLAPEVTDWVLIVKSSYMDIYINTASIEGNSNNVAWKYCFKTQEVRQHLKTIFGLPAVAYHAVEVKHYNDQFTSFNYVCSSYYDRDGRLIGLKRGSDEINSIEANSDDSAEANCAQLLWKYGEEAISYIKERSKSTYNR